MFTPSDPESSTAYAVSAAHWVEIRRRLEAAASSKRQWILVGRFMIAVLHLLSGSKANQLGGVDAHGLCADISETLKPE